MKEVKEDCIIIGENWHDANSFLQGDQYDGIMNYAFTKACLDYYAFDAFGAQEFAWKLNHILMRNTWQVNNMMMNLLDSHDTDRFYTYVHKNKDRVLSALAVMCMFVGAPCIYYGTEIALEGGYDPDNRRCFDWEEKNWDIPFMEKVKALLRLRKEEVIQSGEIRITAAGKLFCLSRFSKGEEFVLLANQSGEALAWEEEGEILLENGIEDNVLKTDGFLILKRRHK